MNFPSVARRSGARPGWLSVLLACGLIGAAGTVAAADTARSTSLQQVPSAVSAGQASFLHRLDGSRHLKLAVNLPLRDEPGLQSLIAQLYDPVSPLYHRYLTNEQFTARFSPSQADYDAVVDWARAQGFTVTRTTSNRHLVDLDGTVEVIERALHVQMGSYRHPNEQRAFFAPDREPSLALAVPVLQITGLDDYTLPTPRLKRGDGSLRLGPVVHAGGSGPGGVFLPSDMRAAYYGAGPLTGAGQTVAVFSFAPYNKEDIGLFYSLTGETPTQVPINDVAVNGYVNYCGDCDDGEPVLDIVNVLGVAPGLSQLLFYEGDSGTDILNQIATDNLAQVISCSWGSTDLGHVADPIYQQFQAQGQTFANATGDDGSYSASSWLPPSANSYALEVGGTDLTVTGPGGSWTGETAWHDGGGGFYAPAGYAIPAWQQLAGVITATNHGSTAWRNDPDVSAEANYDNPTVIAGHLASGYGGTSFAAPRWSGFIALANEQAVANGGAALGFVNPQLYAIGTGANAATDFNDPHSGNNGGFQALAGYDLATGWGSPNGAHLIADLSGSTSAPGYVLANYPAKTSALRGASATTTITVGALNGFGDPVTLSVGSLPNGVTASFDPPTTNSSSVLTLSAVSDAPLGVAPVVISGSAGTQTRTTTVSFQVGNAAAASATPTSIAFDRVVPLGLQGVRLTLSNAADSVPLTYTVTAAATSSKQADGSECSGAAPSWLSVRGASSGAVDGGQTAGFSVHIEPAGALALGDYTAAICIATSDPAQANIVVPVNITIVPGPLSDTIFASGMELNESTDYPGVYTFDVDAAVDQSQAGSGLDLATGNYHFFDGAVADSINPYFDGSSLMFYWYDDLLAAPFSHQVGGVTVSGKYAVLQSGATIGPSSTFSRDDTNEALTTNWAAGTDGYLGVAFRNSRTGHLNYGYIHLHTTAPAGFPAQVLDYGFDDSGAAITIP